MPRHRQDHEDPRSSRPVTTETGSAPAGAALIITLDRVPKLMPNEQELLLVNALGRRRPDRADNHRGGANKSDREQNENEGEAACLTIVRLIGEHCRLKLVERNTVPADTIRTATDIGNPVDVAVRSSYGHPGIG